MRICYVAHADAHFIPAYVDFFTNAGHEIHIISPHPDDIPNAIMHHPAGKNFDPMKASWQYFCMAGKVKKMIRQIKPDIVHAHFLTSNGLMAAMSGFHPLIISAHGGDVNDSIGPLHRRMVVKYTVKRADLINIVSSDMEQQLVDIGVPREKLFDLTLGIDSPKFLIERTATDRTPIRILCNRKYWPIYQCDIIIEAARILDEKDIDFSLIFSAFGPDEEKLKDMVNRYSLNHKISFAGTYKLDDLPSMLADTDIYVSASLSDGTSLSLLEAMAAGTFLIVSDIAANRIWLTGDGDGFLFEVGNPEHLAQCFTRAIKDVDLRNGAIEINQKRVSERGDRETNMRIIESYYKKLVGRAN